MFADVSLEPRWRHSVFPPGYPDAPRLCTPASDEGYGRIPHCAFSRPPGTTLFVDGNAFELSSDVAFAGELLCKAPRMSARDLGPFLEGAGEGLANLMHELLREGFLYPADD